MGMKFKVDDKYGQFYKDVKKLEEIFEPEVKKFLNEEADLGAKTISDYYKEKGHVQTGKLAKSWKKTRAKKVARGLKADIKSYSNLFHLVEYGHLQVLGGKKPPNKSKTGMYAGKSGHIVGYVKGKYPLQAVAPKVREEYIEHMNILLDDLFNRSGL